jgi:MoaD family protein
MKVSIKYFGQLRQIAGVEIEERELDDGGSLQDLISERAKSFGEDFAAIVVDESGAPRPSLMVLRNGDVVDKAKPVALADGDEVSLLPAIAGG